jgi:ubiquitin-like protein Pup
VSGSGGNQDRTSARRPADDSPPEPVTPALGQTARPLLDDIEGLLDEIDAVLEVNAEEFVRGYVQKGGE